MRILSWNINGIRTLPQYHPWNALKNCEGILDELKAEIICFQEMKSSRAGLSRDVALPGNYDSFFSFPVSKGGYSGVAVYTDSRHIVPLKAEEGLSGKLQPKPSLSAEERVSRLYPCLDDIEAFPDEDGNVPATFDALDSEGRGLVVDFGLFVLINVYCPNETSQARASFKMNYHLMLEDRVKKLMQEGREVIVLGDMNICATPMDHCDGHLPSNTGTFWDYPARAWFHQWLGPIGPMTDIVRSYWPDRKGMYTCWNTKLSARETNYGTRVDYILATMGLLRWVKHGDIQASLKGSDHCPIYIDLHDEIVLESGETLTLKDAMRQGTEKRQPPRLAARHWEELSGKQTLLSSFFGQGRPSKSEETVRTQLQSDSVDTAKLLVPSGSTIEAGSQKTTSTSPPLVDLPPERKPIKPSTSRIVPNNAKRKPAEVLVPSTSKKTKKQLSAQGSLPSFFDKPKLSAKTSSQEIIDVDAIMSQAPEEPDSITLSQSDADARLALELSALSEDDASPIPPQASSSDSKAAWSSLFAPNLPPKCTVHNEPTKKYTANKTGPNKGRSFYLCSRPVGPGWDRGKSERLRSEVDYRYRCNYFKWASDAKRQSRGTFVEGNVTYIGSP